MGFFLKIVGWCGAVRGGGVELFARDGETGGCGVEVLGGLLVELVEFGEVFFDLGNLRRGALGREEPAVTGIGEQFRDRVNEGLDLGGFEFEAIAEPLLEEDLGEIGRASCRERVLHTV